MKLFNQLFPSVNALKVVPALALLFCAAQAPAQVFQPGILGTFGVDADVRTDTRHKGTFTATGSHDWLPQNGVSNYAVFDTTGSGYWLSQVLLGRNFSFTKQMTAEPYTLQAGKLMLDGLYARDYFGWDRTGQRRDQTAFVSTNTVSNKNAGNPSLWTVEQNGTSVPSKSDIVDTYIHMRRNGNSIAVGNPSNLIVYMGAALLGTDGDHHVDFELFKDTMAYDGQSNLFSHSGPAATGGRYPWEFNPDGTIRSFGNLAMSFSFSSSSVDEISIYLWVHYSTLRNVSPAAFEFVESDWNGLSSSDGYGFVKVQLRNFSPLPAFAAVNTGTVAGPQWGTNSKDLGIVGDSYAATSYAPGQFVEGAIDLTALGIDPALSTVFDRCTPPYRRVLVKSRSSSSFSSALQDFVGPHRFLDAPTVPADIQTPPFITCTVEGVTLRPVHEIIGASYTWSTRDGNIMTDPNNMTVQVNSKGLYTLTTSIMQGCTPKTEDVRVYERKNQPAARAKASGVLMDIDGDQVLEPVMLLPEVTTTNHEQGLKYKWRGPNGFTSTAAQPQTNVPGSYFVTITDVATGCSCEAPLALEATTFTVLPVKFVDEQAATTGDGVQVSWSLDASSTASFFTIERSVDGRSFTEVGNSPAVQRGGSRAYTFIDRNPVSGRSFYRIKGVEPSGKSAFSKIMPVEATTTHSTLRAFHDAGQGVTVDFRSDRQQAVTTELYNASGQLLISQRQTAYSGTNRFRLAPKLPMVQGMFLLVVQTEAGRQSVKLMKQ